MDKDWISFPRAVDLIAVRYGGKLQASAALGGLIKRERIACTCARLEFHRPGGEVYVHENVGPEAHLGNILAESSGRPASEDWVLGNIAFTRPNGTKVIIEGFRVSWADCAKLFAVNPDDGPHGQPEAAPPEAAPESRPPIVAIGGKERLAAMEAVAAQLDGCGIAARSVRAPHVDKLWDAAAYGQRPDVDAFRALMKGSGKGGRGRKGRAADDAIAELSHKTVT